MDFIDKIKARARTRQMRIVFPESGEPRTAEAAGIIAREGIARPILLSGGDSLRAAEGVEVVDLNSPAYVEKFTELLFELRRNKGVTREAAAELLKNPVYFGTMLVYTGEADGLVAGAVNTTANTLRPALQILKKGGDATVSSFFAVNVPNCKYGAEGMFLFADAGLIENPDSAQLAKIACDSARSFEGLTGVEPVVAMLSYSTLGSAKSASTEKVIEAVRLAHEIYPNLRLDGELQLDAAIDPAVAALKAPHSRVAGQANVLIFPDLDAGNIGYKLVQRLAKAEAYGPVTQGLAKPVNDLSRGCSVEDIVGVAAITCVQAMAL